MGSFGSFLYINNFPRRKSFFGCPPSVVCRCVVVCRWVRLYLGEFSNCRSGPGASGRLFRSPGGACERNPTGRHVLLCFGFQLHATDLSFVAVWQCAGGSGSIGEFSSCRSGPGASGRRFRSPGRGCARKTTGRHVWPCFGFQLHTTEGGQANCDIFLAILHILDARGHNSTKAT